MAIFWFDTIIPAITISLNQELSLALGARTLVYLTGAGSFQLFGISGTGGNQDGAVVTVQNVSNSASVQYTFINESGSTSSVLNRFRNNNGSNIASGSGVGGATYRYFGSISRWIMMSHT